MKRFLLTLICAMAMIAVNAHTVKKLDPSKFNNIKPMKALNFKQKSASLNISNAMVQAAKTIKNTPAKAKRNAAPSSLENLEGSWVKEHTHWADEVTAFNIASQVEITMEEDEMGQYVILSGQFGDDMFDVTAELVGEYDPETGLLSIAPQICGEDEDYGPLAFCGSTEEDYDLKNPYTLQVEQDENGHISMENTSEFPWYIFIYEGDYAGAYLTEGDGLLMNQPNFEFTGSEKHVENSAWTPYVDVDGEYVYVENIEGTVIVHGMWGTSIMLSMAEDGINFTVPNGQPISAGWTSNTDFITFTNYNVDALNDNWDVPTTGEDFSADPDLEVPGYISSTGAYVFASTERDAEGYIQWDYFYIAKMMTEDGRGYFKNLWAAIILLPLEEEENGISSVNNTVKANNITFNAAGQKVNKDYKGLVIRNGQKFMNK